MAWYDEIRGVIGGVGQVDCVKWRSLGRKDQDVLARCTTNLKMGLTRVLAAPRSILV